MEDDSAPIEHILSVGMGRKSGPYNNIVPARLSAQTDWSAVLNWRKIVVHILNIKQRALLIKTYSMVGIPLLGQSHLVRLFIQNIVGNN